MCCLTILWGFVLQYDTLSDGWEERVLKFDDLFSACLCIYLAAHIVWRMNHLDRHNM